MKEKETEYKKNTEKEQEDLKIQIKKMQEGKSLLFLSAYFNNFVLVLF